MPVSILGVATYPADKVWSNVDLLARSVAVNSPDVELALITAPLGDRDRALFREFNVRGIELAAPAPTFDRSTEAGKADYHTWLCGIFGARHTWYLAALDVLDATHVLLADTRDVVVTGPLSAKTNVDTLVLSQENASTSIAVDPWNSKWVMGAYGMEGLTRLRDKPILCAGTVFGPVSLMKKYITAMRAEIARLGDDTVRRVGDQPVHNYLAYTSQLPPYVISTAETGWLKSVGLTPTHELEFDWLPKTPPVRGERTIVLHQYDRHASSRGLCSAIRCTTGLAWWKNIYAPFDAHPGVRLARIGSRMVNRLCGHPTREY
jgi:hypothetical protein